MGTTEALRKQLKVTRELQSVVKTMKALAAVNIRQFENAALSLTRYTETVQEGFQVVLKGRTVVPAAPVKRGQPAARALIVFGTDQGMCGPFNERIASYAAGRYRGRGGAAVPRVIAVGARALASLQEHGVAVESTLPVPGTVSAIRGTVLQLLAIAQRWTEQASDIEVVLVYHRKKPEETAYVPQETRLLPVDPDRLRELQRRPWKSRTIPMYTLPYAQMLASLVRHYLFSTVYMALVLSLAAENASRLAAMQAAERNIEDRLKDLTMALHRERQSRITDELLDIVAGFEALTKGS
jgi:F-type H+-transporting ATPase subunit gamma